MALEGSLEGEADSSLRSPSLSWSAQAFLGHLVTSVCNGLKHRARAGPGPVQWPGQGNPAESVSLSSNGDSYGHVKGTLEPTERASTGNVSSKRNNTALNDNSKYKMNTEEAILT